MKRYDVIIVGGGIMGVLGAYTLSAQGLRVAIIEKWTIGNAQAGSSGITRSLRTDYEDPVYAQLAAQSWAQWQRLQDVLGVELIRQTGCLNLAQTNKESVTYAEKAARWLARDKRTARTWKGASAVNTAHPQFKRFNFAVEESLAGLGFPAIALETLKAAISPRCTILENTIIKSITSSPKTVLVETSAGSLRTPKLIIAAGLGSSEVLAAVAGLKMTVPLTADRPAECLYYVPKNSKRYATDSLPVFACLDQGIYGHPIVVGKTKGVKIGRYMPPQSVNEAFQGATQTIQAFVRQHMPDLARQATVQPVTDTDQCSYDMTPDGNFIVGALTTNPNIFVAVGFCGTGYKFAPVIADLMVDFASSKTPRYRTELFNPERFNYNQG